MKPGLTLREARELLASIPDEHLDKLVFVSVGAGYVTEGLVDDWEIEDSVIMIHTTGDSLWPRRRP